MRALIVLLLASASLYGQSLEEVLRVLKPGRPPGAGRINAVDRTWEDWIRRTGAKPPDFARMPSIPDLPDPLLMDGVPITTQAQWTRQKKELRAAVEHWLFGTMPPPPGNVRGEVTATRREGGTTVREVLLRFGPGMKGTLRIELIVPDGKGPHPVFLTNHARTRSWIYTAVRRGYIACIYHAADPRYGHGDDSDAYIELYPEYDFSCLSRWAWAASRAIDYLLTLPEVDGKKIGITGHSRGGKSALVAAAFDERIGAVIPSSGNSGECDPWRYTTEPFVNESIELLAGVQTHWFHPRLRFFSGREDKLPVDQNTLLALVAPRGLMMYSGYAESAGNPFGFEQGYRSALSVYKFLGREQNIWLHLRAGEHATTAGDVENFIDFFDSVFGRRVRPKTETWIHGYTFDGWRKLSGETVDASKYPAAAFRAPQSAAAWDGEKQRLRKRIGWALGEEPPGVPNVKFREPPSQSTASEGWLAGLFRRPAEDSGTVQRIAKEGMRWAQLPFGDGLKADLFLPAAKPQGKLPVVVWLHPYAYQNGWSAQQPWASTGSDYRLDQRPSFPALVKMGFAVLAFDQIGFGTRVLDAKEFYARYPKWSLAGKMVTDTRAAVEAVAALDAVDASRIYLLGYSLGAKVGLLTAALDDRIAGVAAVSGFDPLRLATKDRGVEGVRHYSHLHGLMPRLGFFAGQEARLPFDFDEVLAAAAPRPVLLVAPTLDRYARIADVRAEVAESRKVWRLLGREDALSLDTPEDLNRFDRKMQGRAYEWLAALSGRR